MKNLKPEQLEQHKLYSEPYHWARPESRYRMDFNIALGFAKNTANVRMLDAGCGDGLFTAELTKKSSRVFGIDYDAHAISFARELVPGAKFFVRNIRKTGFKKNFFDIVFMRHVLEHIPKEGRKAVAREMARIIKTSGVLVVQGPTKKIPKQKTHFEHFSAVDLELLFGKDFVLEKTIGYDSATRRAGLIRWLFKKNPFPIRNSNFIAKFLQRPPEKAQIITAALKRKQRKKKIKAHNLPAKAGYLCIKKAGKTKAYNLFNAYTIVLDENLPL